MKPNKFSIWSRITGKAARIIDDNLNLVLTGVDTARKAVALTFDDGPHPEKTPRLLDLLEKYRAKATFFVVGVPFLNFASKRRSSGKP